MAGIFISFALAAVVAPEPAAPQPAQANERVCRGGGERTARQSCPHPSPLPDRRAMAAGG